MLDKAYDYEIKFLKGVGPKKAELYNKVGVYSIGDLLHYFPRAYIDLTQPKRISQAYPDEVVAIKGYVKRKLPPAMIRRGMTVFKFIFTDGYSDLTVVIFNSKYAFGGIEEGKDYVLYGKISGNEFRKEMNSPLIVDADLDIGQMPVYPLTKGLTQNTIKKDIKTALTLYGEYLVDPLGVDIQKRYDLIDYKTALHKIHFATKPADINEAKHRFVFEELLSLSLGMSLLRNRNRQKTGVKIKDTDLTPFISSLPFTLTSAQHRAIEDCVFDMKREYPMNRLIQGDVGSGKTAVAAAACYYCSKGGYQSAVMAPTEILANQHYATFAKFLEPLGLKIALLTGSLTAKQKRVMRADIKNGEYDVVIGTHALVQKETEFNKLGLVVTDEQHRFGVHARSSLLEKGENPHAIVMSATPIPRTLALIIYGDLDISVLDELPKGRQKIVTYVVSGRKREGAYNFILNEIANGRQAYIVCPMIEENDNELASAKKYAETLSNGAFRNVSVGLLHGKMSANEKEKVMASFLSGDIKLLVATTVIEVGIDVPNATVMYIENAERFGLSQLHQLRGRVGRGSHQSYCILISDKMTETTRARLKVMAKTSDGFVIAQEDLKQRGPGDFFGHRQHGLPPMRIADMSEDINILRDAQDLSEKVLKKDPDLLKHPELYDLVEDLFDRAEQYGFN